MQIEVVENTLFNVLGIALASVLRMVCRRDGRQ